MTPPLRVVAALNRAKVPYVIMGDHAVTAWTRESRVLKETEVLVPPQCQRRAAAALKTNLRVAATADWLGNISLAARRPDIRINIRKPQSRLECVMFEHVKKKETQRRSYRIPSLEMALALRYASIVSVYQSGSMRRLHAYDFAVLLLQNPTLDRNTLQELGERVHHGGGKGIWKYVQQTRAEENPAL